MKATIQVTDSSGNTFEGEVVLEPKAGRARTRRVRPATGAPAPHAPRDLDFGLSSRAFVRKYGGLAESGPKKFVLLLSWIAKGRTDSQIDAEALRREWAKVKGLIGAEYQTMFATRARDNGWVDSPKHGVFQLGRGWRDALSS